MLSSGLTLAEKNVCAEPLVVVSIPKMIRYTTSRICHPLLMWLHFVKDFFLWKTITMPKLP